MDLFVYLYIAIDIYNYSDFQIYINTYLFKSKSIENMDVEVHEGQKGEMIISASLKEFTATF